MTLSAEERNAIINNRIEKSRQALYAAKCNIEMQLWTTAANRLYYAAYNMASALLVKNNHTAHTLLALSGY
ncbi:MAG: hypothetical protein LIP06_10690 [Tannerellaceae bacterium]|nr:hypothetical protein [Tannerellaceae bacterium]